MLIYCAGVVQRIRQETSNLLIRVRLPTPVLICSVWRNGIRAGLWLRILQVQILSHYPCRGSQTVRLQTENLPCGGSTPPLGTTEAVKLLLTRVA